MQRVFIDQKWVVDKYLMMECKKAWSQLDVENDMNVLNLEMQILADEMGYEHVKLHPPTYSDSEPVLDSEDVPLLDD